MLEGFLRWLKRGVKPHPDSPADAEPLSGDDRTDRTEIFWLLADLQRENALLTIRLPDHPHTYLSSILELDRHSGNLLLDHCKPSNGHDLLLQCKSFWIATHLHGVALTFTATHPGLAEREGVLAYRIPIPSRIHYPQRRNGQRFRPLFGVPVRFEMDTPGDIGFLRGELADLSEHGLAAWVSPMYVAAGHKLPRCRLIFPDGSLVEFSLLVRHVHKSSRESKIRIGGSFVDISPAMLKIVERFLASLEREQLRRLREVPPMPPSKSRPASKIV